MHRLVWPLPQCSLMTCFINLLTSLHFPLHLINKIELMWWIDYKNDHNPNPSIHCNMTLLLLPLRGGIDFPSPWIWGWSCDLLWWIKCGHHEGELVLSWNLKGPCMLLPALLELCCLHSEDKLGWLAGKRRVMWGEVPIILATPTEAVLDQPPLLPSSWHASINMLHQVWPNTAWISKTDPGWWATLETDKIQQKGTVWSYWALGCVMCMWAKVLQSVRLFATLWNVAHQAPLSIGL